MLPSLPWNAVLFIVIFWLLIMEKYLDQSVVGQFALGDAMYFGTLTLGSSKTILTIYLDAESAPLISQPYPQDLAGVLYDLTKVTLLDSIFIGGGTYTKQVPLGGYARSRQLIFDVGYVLFSDSSVNGHQRIFDCLDFSIPNSNDLFFFRSFTSLIDVPDHLPKDLITEDLRLSKEKFGLSMDVNTYSFGDSPKVFLYTGASILSTLRLPLGTLNIKNNPIYTMPTNKGFKVENEISCYLDFDEPKSFWEITKEIESILQLLDLLLGKRQILKSYKLKVNNNKVHPKVFDVYHSAHETEALNDSIHPLERLIQVENETEEFEKVINDWLLKQEEWKFPRGHYFSVFRKPTYTPDTIVKLANVFDLVPDRAYSAEPLSDEILIAKKLCRDAFHPLEDSPERSSVLLNLKRLGEKTLKHKIIDRYEIIKSSGFVDLKYMNDVITNSVDCRNYFVHGNYRKFDYIENFTEFCFLIDTLLFIYGISEMLEAGWTFKNWKPDELNQHFFSRYIVNYDLNLERLKEVSKKGFGIQV